MKRRNCVNLCSILTIRLYFIKEIALVWCLEKQSVKSHYISKQRESKSTLRKFEFMWEIYVTVTCNLEEN